MFYLKKRMAVFGMQKREKNTKVFSSNTYIRNTKNRIIFGVNCWKNHGDYTKILGKIEQNI